MTAHEIGFALGGLFAFAGISILLMTAGEVGSVIGGLFALAGIGLMLSYGFRKVMGTVPFLFVEAYFAPIVILLIALPVIVIVIVNAVIDLL